MLMVGTCLDNIFQHLLVKLFEHLTVPLAKDVIDLNELIIHLAEVFVLRGDLNGKLGHLVLERFLHKLFSLKHFSHLFPFFLALDLLIKDLELIKNDCLDISETL